MAFPFDHPDGETLDGAFFTSIEERAAAAMESIPQGPVGPEGPPFSPQGVYNAGTVYVEGALVTFSGLPYVSLTAGNVGNEPDTSPTKWLQLLALPSSVETIVAANGATDGTALTAAWAAEPEAVLKLIRGQTYILDTAITFPPGGGVLDVSGATVRRKSSYSSNPNNLGQGPYLIQNAAVNPLRSVSDATFIGGTLATALTGGTAITTIVLSAGIAAPIPASGLVTVNTGGANPVYQTFALSAPAASGATSLPVASQVASTTFAIGDAIVSNVLSSATAAFTSADVGRTINLMAGRISTVLGETAPTPLYTTIASVTSSSLVNTVECGQQPVTGATLNIYTRDGAVMLIGDADTVIDNGTITVGAHGTNPKAIQFRRAAACLVHLGGASCIGGTIEGQQFLSPGDIGYLEVDGMACTLGMGGPQPCGPIGTAKVTNIRGTTGDDIVAFQTAAFGYSTWDANDCQGAIGTIVASDIYPTMAAHVLLLIGGYDGANVDCPIGDVTVERVGGTSQVGIAINSEGGGTLNIGQVTFRDIDHTTTDTTATTGALYCEPKSVDSLVLDNVRMTPAIAGTSASRQLVVLLAGTSNGVTNYGNVVLRNVRGVGGYVDTVQAGGTVIDHLALENCCPASSTGGRLCYVGPFYGTPGTVNHLDLTGVRLHTGDSASQSSILTVASGSTVGEVNASKFHIDSSTGNTWAQAFSFLNAGQASPTILRLAQGSFAGSGSYAIVTAAPLNVWLGSGVTFAHTGDVIEATGGAAVTMTADPTVDWSGVGGTAMIQTTFASFPSASAVPGAFAVATDQNYALYQSQASSWVLLRGALQSLIAHAAASAPSPGATATTAAVNTTGASLLACAVGFYEAVTPVLADLTDSAGNTWTLLPLYKGSVAATAIYVCTHPTTSATHTVTFSLTGSYPSIAFAAFSGTLASGTADVNVGATSSSGTIQPGSGTPAHNNELILTAVGFWNAVSVAVNSGFTITDQKPEASGVCGGVALGYLSQGPAVALNPAWTGSGLSGGAAAMASFQA